MKRADKYRILVVVVLVADAANASNTISLTARGKARDSLVAFDRSSLLLLKRLEGPKGRPFVPAYTLLFLLPSFDFILLTFFSSIFRLKNSTSNNSCIFEGDKNVADFEEVGTNYKAYLPKEELEMEEI